MAKAEKKEQIEIQITLSKEEAEVLRDVLCSIGGSPRYSPRKHTDSINQALRSAGVDNLEFEKEDNDCIYYADY